MATEEQITRWQNEMDAVRAAMEEGQVQVGDAIMKEYSREERSLYSISRWGRMVRNEGQVSFFAAPSVVKSPELVQSEVKYENLGKKFLMKGATENKHSVKPFPVYIRKKGGSSIIQTTQLVVKTFFHDEVVVHNPSNTTSYAANQSSENFRAIITDENVHDEYKMRFPRAQVLRSYQGDSPVFLGTSLPTQGYKKWFALLPNPYYAHDYTQKVSFQESPGQMTITVKRKGQEHIWKFQQSSLLGLGPVKIYSPTQLQGIGMDHSHFIISNYDMGIQAIGSEYILSSPLYLPVRPLESRIVKENNEKKYKLKVDKLGYVHDVKYWDADRWSYRYTYFSRREELPHLNWVAYTETGRPITFFTVSTPKTIIRAEQHGEKEVKVASQYCLVAGKPERPTHEAVIFNPGVHQQSPDHSVTVIPAERFSDGTIKVELDQVGKDQILFLSVEEFDSIKWTQYTAKPAMMFSMYKEDQMKFHNLQQKHSDLFLPTNLEIERGITEWDRKANGVSLQQMKVSGYIRYKDRWYIPWATEGVIRTGGGQPKKGFVDADEMSYSVFFSKAGLSNVSERRFYLGAQVLKVKEVCQAMGIPAYVPLAGHLKIVSLQFVRGL